jgi:glycosyltransferase involved in cell wall biosynthesis
MQKKKILFIICELYWGGAQKSLLKLVAEVSKRHDCVLAVYEVDKSFTQPIPVPLIVMDNEIKIKMAKRSLLAKIERLYKRYTFLKNYKKANKIDVCISFMEGADILNVLSKNKNCKTITSIRGSIKDAVRPEGIVTKIYLKAVLPFIYKRSDLIVPVSNLLKPEMIKMFAIRPDKIMPIQNFYDIELFQKLKEETIEDAFLPLFNNNKIIVAVGRLNIQKNFISLIKLFSVFKKKSVEKFQLMVIGIGEELPVLLNECDNQQLTYFNYEKPENEKLADADVLFIGYQANPHKFVARARCFLLTSLWEGFPNTLAEAMIVGAPCIAADCATGPFEIIEPLPQKTEYQLPAVLLPIPNTTAINQQWANMLQRITTEEDLKAALKKNAVARMNDFSREKIIGEWYNLIEA